MLHAAWATVTEYEPPPTSTQSFRAHARNLRPFPQLGSLLPSRGRRQAVRASSAAAEFKRYRFLAALGMTTWGLSRRGRYTW